MPQSLHASAATAAAAVYWQTYGEPAHLISQSSYFISDTHIVTLQSAGEGFIYNKDILGVGGNAEKQPSQYFFFMLCYIFFSPLKEITQLPPLTPAPSVFISVISS